MEVTPGVHLVDGTWGGNVYLLLDDDGFALVDAALPGNAGKVLRYIRSLGRDPADLRYVVITHAHPDHTGTIPSLLRHASAKVAIHREDTRGDGSEHPWLFYPGQLITTPWNLPFLRKIHAHRLIGEGDTLPILGEMRVLHTPGPTPGSISLYLEERGVLFTGDVLLSNGKSFSRALPLPGTDFKLYRRSVERLSQLDFDVACVGHGKPIVGGAQAEVHRMLGRYFRSGAWFALARKLTRGSWV